jgi:hypothetical protein
MTAKMGITLTREQLEAWAGRTLTDDQVSGIAQAIPHSPVPLAITVIAEDLPDQEPEFTSPAYDAFRALTVEQRAELADGMFRILEFDEEGKPGAVWSSDTPQAMGDLLNQRHSIDLTPPSGPDW